MRAGWWASARGFALDLWRKYQADDASDAAAALTFYSMLALFPFLIGVVSLASLVLDPDVVEVLIADLGRIAPPEVTRLVGNQVYSLVSSGSSSILTLSAFGAYWAASGGISALMRVLNQVNEVKETRPIWAAKGISLAATFVGASFLLIAAVVAVATPSVARAIGGPLGHLIRWVRIPVAGATAMFAWGLFYHFLPNIKRPFRFFTPGAVLAVIVWLVASWGFSQYVVNFGKYEVTYGALGAVVVLLVWMWISALVVILGAEFNLLLERRGDRGDRGGRPPGG